MTRHKPLRERLFEATFGRLVALLFRRGGQ